MRMEKSSVQEEKRKPGRPRGSEVPKSDAVRRVRETLGLTQEQFAQEMGCTGSTIAKAEGGGRLLQPRLMPRLRELAKRAGVEVS